MSIIFYSRPNFKFVRSSIGNQLGEKGRKDVIDLLVQKDLEFSLYSTKSIHIIKLQNWSLLTLMSLFKIGSFYTSRDFLNYCE